MQVVSCLVFQHNLWLVALAAFVCVSGTLITFGLYSRARTRSGPQMIGWTFLTAVAGGASIWCTHFIGMLAYEVTAPVSFDAYLTMASLVIAIAGCGLGFGLAASDRRITAYPVCGAIIGLSIASMHYTGMAAYHVAGYVEWSPLYIAVSIGIAAVLGALALDEESRRPRAYSRIFAVVMFVFAIVGLHFTGMTGVTVTPMSGVPAIDNKAAFSAIAMAVAGVGMIIIGTGLASYLIDKNSSQESMEKLRRMALNDDLTGLPNRAHFTNYLAMEIQRAKDHDQRLAIVGIDLDRFKEVNDHHGHEAGDRVLASIGGALGCILKPGEFVARVGGDEFSAVKRYCTIQEVHEFAARIQSVLNTSLVLADLRVVTGGSVGISLYPDDGSDAERLVTSADLAMYRAKQDGERSICFYEEKMDEAARLRSVLSADLRQAIVNEEFELYYQVQCDVVTGEVSGYEALLRWHHPERGMIPPMEFIPIAEATGIIVDIGAWVLRTACKEGATWDEPHRIAVNVSGVQLRHGDFAADVHAILLETGFSPSRLEIEITETSIIEDRARALNILRRVRTLGVTVALDDFGTGYSSLETLRCFPFDKIKLDRSFTQGLENDVQAKAIVRSVLALGKNLNVKVLAEGVETNVQYSVLKTEGCDEVQGYYFGRPQRLVASAAEGLNVPEEDLAKTA